MARYFFRLNECGAVLNDDEGREIATDKLFEVAMREARTIMSDEVRQGKLCLGCRIDVYDASDKLVLTLPFRDAVTITGGEQG